MLQRRKADNPSTNKWTTKEESDLLNYLLNEQVDAKTLKSSLARRTKSAIRAKTRKLRIKHDLFGDGYRTDKQNFTRKIAAKAKPKVVYEAYAGAGHQTLIWIEYSDIVYATDKSKKKQEQFLKTILEAGFRQYKSEGNWFQYRKGKKRVYFYCGDVLAGAAALKVSGVKIDLIDLDTCGSSLPILPSLLALLNPIHLVVTHGEFHSLRFRRDDVLRRILFHRDINDSPFPMTIEELATELDKAVKIASLRAHNETCNSFWAELKEEIWLGSKVQGMLRRYYRISRPKATADCLNELIEN